MVNSLTDLRAVELATTVVQVKDLSHMVDCNDTEVLARFRQVAADIETAGDPLFTELLAIHQVEVEDEADFTECQRTPRRKALVELWEETRNG